MLLSALKARTGRGGSWLASKTNNIFNHLLMTNPDLQRARPNAHFKATV
jgi:hypothetical protein